MIDINNGSLIAQGACMTLILWLLALIISISVGTVIGTLQSGYLICPLPVRVALDLITRVLRGIPFYLQLLIMYFVVPLCMRCSLSAFTASVVALGLCSAAYVGQIICGGIQAYDEALWEMTQVLGYSRLQAMFYLVLPQVFRKNMLALSGEVDQLIKTTAVCSTIGVLDLMGVTRNIIAREMNPVSMYLVTAVLFLCISTAWHLFVGWLRRRICYVGA